MYNMNYSCVKSIYVPLRNPMDLLDTNQPLNAPFSIYDASSYTDYKKNIVMYQQYKKDVCLPIYGSYREKQSIEKGYKNSKNKCLCK